MTSSMMRADEWKKAVAGHPAHPLIDRVQWLLMSYHRQPSTATSERSRILGDLTKEVGQVLKNYAKTHPLFPAFFDVSSQAIKQLTGISKPQSAWGQARKIFGPSKGAPGSTRTMHHHNLDENTATSENNYWLEALDPKHRSWGHMDRSTQYFQSWLNDVSTSLSFWDWLEEKKLAEDWSTVRYLDPKERWKYMCVFSDDKRIYQYKQNGLIGKGEIPLDIFSTANNTTVFSGQGAAIWVCSPGGIFYSGDHTKSQFHHSSFLAGGRVLAAGEWIVSAGRLLLISHKTGHYAATPQNLLKALRLLSSRVNLTRTVVAISNFSTGEKKVVTAQDFMGKNGDYQQCPSIINADNIFQEAKNRCSKGIDWDRDHVRDSVPASANVKGGAEDIYARGLSSNSVSIPANKGSGARYDI